MGADFKSTAYAALEMAPILLPQWIGGKRQGHEWVGERKSNGGPGDSWSVNLNTGAWGGFATGEAGGDLVSLYAALNHLNQGAALEQVAGLVGVSDRPIHVLPRTQPAESRLESKAEPIPLDAPPIPDHFKHGAASAVYRYGTAFVIARYDLPEGKQFSPFTWRSGGWKAKAYPEPRPLYHVDDLAKHPNAPVLIVEGEKCADVARATLRAYVVLTWAGGALAVKKSDWSSLAGRDVIIWPDADEPGARAAATLAEILLTVSTRVRVINPEGQPAGWDVADAVASGMAPKQITTWAAAHIRVVSPLEPEPIEPEPPSEPITMPLTAQPPAGEVEAGAVEAGAQQESALVNWHSLGLDCNEGGSPHPTVANASLILQAHPELRGKIWYDLFTDKIYHTLRGAAVQWRDNDDIDLTVLIQQSLHLPKFNIMLVAAAVTHAARRIARNSLTDWLNGLIWDGEPRLESWLSDCLGVEHNEYSMAIACNWPISMVARAYVPGCKVDTMPVLEGPQGMSKSSFLEILGDPWYASIPTAFGDKDFLQAIQGHWLIEIPDMTGFSKREHSHILATMTIRNDLYRASYGRHTVEHPRTAIFAATSETDDYLQDTRGRRRYWPLRCKAIDLDTLHAQREQVFAEARDQYKAGAKWYEMPEGSDAEQRARATPDLWSDRVVEYANSLWAQSQGGTNGVLITSTRILADAIEMPLSKQTDGEKRRIARIMRENGWKQARDLTGRRWKKIEYP